jgi:Gpi18-like mannosyltransferase
VALLIRVAVFNQETADYVTHLSEWVNTFRVHGAAALAQDVGDYNLPYQYILVLIAQLPLEDLYLIKMVSVFFDFALAILMMLLAERFLNRRYGLAALITVLLLPTVWFNGAFWAQCDALYCFFVAACLYAMLADRPVLSVAMLTVAFSFKIQTVFFFPVVLLALWGKKYKLRHILVFPAVYLLMMTPALIAGCSLSSALTIYLRQASQYNERLTYNAANIYQFFPFGELSMQPAFTPILKFIPGVDPTAWNEWYTPETVRYLLGALVPYAGMLVLCLLYYLFMRRRYIGMDQVWRLSLAFTLLMPLVLPKMHDRYFTLAEMFSILYAVRYPKRWYVPVLVIFASFESYMPFLARERPVDMRIAAAMMVAAMGIVLTDIVRELRAAEASDPGTEENA